MAMWPFWGGNQEDVGADKGKKKKAKKLTPRQVCLCRLLQKLITVPGNGAPARCCPCP